MIAIVNVIYLKKGSEHFCSPPLSEMHQRSCGSMAQSGTDRSAAETIDANAGEDRLSVPYSVACSASLDTPSPAMIAIIWWLIFCTSPRLRRNTVMSFAHPAIYPNE